MSEDGSSSKPKPKISTKPGKVKTKKVKFEDLDLDIPGEFKKRKSFTEAEVQWLVARSSAFMPPAKFVCIKDLTTGLCVRYNRDQTGDYSIPDGLPARDCKVCNSER